MYFLTLVLTIYKLFIIIIIAIFRFFTYAITMDSEKRSFVHKEPDMIHHYTNVDFGT